MAIIADKEYLMARGYIPLREGPGWKEEDGIRLGEPLEGKGYYGILKKSHAIITRSTSDQSDIYSAVVFISPQKKYDLKREEDLIEIGSPKSIDGLMFYLLNPRFLGINEDTIRLLVELANTPKNKISDGENILKKIDIDIKRVKNESLRERLEWEMDMAATAHILGKPGRYYLA